MGYHDKSFLASGGSNGSGCYAHWNGCPGPGHMHIGDLEGVNLPKTVTIKTRAHHHSILGRMDGGTDKAASVLASKVQ